MSFFQTARAGATSRRRTASAGASLLSEPKDHTSPRSVECSLRLADLLRLASYTRGDWVEDPEGGYYSDYDLAVVVATEEIAKDNELWSRLSQKCRALTGRTAVTLIVHDIKEINHEIRLGQYFFVDILREGVVLYTSRRFDLARPKALLPADRLALGLVNFRYCNRYSFRRHFLLAGRAAEYGQVLGT